MAMRWKNETLLLAGYTETKKHSMSGTERALVLDMRSNSAGRLVAGLVAIACAGWLLAHAREQSYGSQTDEYVRILDPLERYRVLAAEDDGAVLPEIDQPVKLGGHYEGIPRLIRLLQMTEDLPADTIFTKTDQYGYALVRAVHRFQRRHGLEPNGRIDKATLAQLNTPLKFRVHQLELALERWRRRPYDPARPAIVLNLPEYRLRAFNADNHLDLEMKIVIGQAPEHKTPLLTSELERVIFRPYWNVPISIQRDELIPKIMNDPDYLSANHLEIVTTKGTVVQGDVSDDILADMQSGWLRLRQTPGPGNVLGLVKFAFPNEYEVYMHGTSAPSLFGRARRDLSHGCIRLEKADALAEWVLRQETGWTRNRVMRAMHGAESITVELKRRIQVVTMYATAVVLENGEVHFFEDIYGEDAALDQELVANR